MVFRSMLHAGGGQLPPGSAGDISVVADTDFACGYGIEGGNSGGTIALGSVAAIGDNAFIGFRYKDSGENGGSTGENRLSIQVGSTNCLNLLFKDSGMVSVQRRNALGPFGTEIGSFTIDGTTAPYIEIEWLPHVSAGTLRFRVDGAIAASWTDIVGARSAEATATVTAYTLYIDDTSSGQRSPRVGDIVFYDDTGADWNAFVGPVTIPFLPFDSSGTSDFVGDDADSVDNHLRVDAVPMGTDGYIESNTSAERQELGIDSTSLPPTGSILALQPVLYGLEPSSGSAPLDVGIAEGGTDSALSTVTLAGTEQTHYGDPVFTQPDGGGDWTATPVGNAELVMVVP